jgi:hypothetical protein
LIESGQLSIKLSASTRRTSPITSRHPAQGRNHKHGDLEPSLSITHKPDKGKILMWCHVCGPLGDMDAVREALGVKDADQFDEPISKPKPELLCAGKHPEHTWLMIGTPSKPAVGETWFPREWERGFPIAWKVRQTCRRCDARKFHWRQPDGDRTKPGKPKGVMPLGGLPDLVGAIDSGQPVHVYLTEGDSDAEAVRKAGGLAVTAGGVTDWTPEHFDQLDGVERATVCSDADEPGRKHARWVRDQLDDRGILQRVVEPLVGKDVRDHLEADHSLKELVVIENVDQPEDISPFQFVTGDRFFLDISIDPQPIWGEGSDVLQAEGEALMIAGPAGCRQDHDRPTDRLRAAGCIWVRLAARLPRSSRVHAA